MHVGGTGWHIYTIGSPISNISQCCYNFNTHAHACTHTHTHTHTHACMHTHTHTHTHTCLLLSMSSSTTCMSCCHIYLEAFGHIKIWTMLSWNESCTKAITSLHPQPAHAHQITCQCVSQPVARTQANAYMQERGQSRLIHQVIWSHYSLGTFSTYQV